MKDKIDLAALIPICIGEHEVAIVLEDVEVLEAITGGADLCANGKACVRLGGASDVPCHGHTTVEFGRALPLPSNEATKASILKCVRLLAIIATTELDIVVESDCRALIAAIGAVHKVGSVTHCE